MANPHIPSIEHIATFCKRKGIIFPSAEIYGGFSGFFDYGPLGTQIKRNIEQSWWKRFVTSRQDVVGMDGTTITHGKIWEASGHLQNFSDLVVEDVKTKKRYRADHLVEQVLKLPMDGKTREEINRIIDEHDIKSPDGNALLPAAAFNLMFPVQVGVDKENVGYLRGETAQSIFTQFRNITQNTRVQLPFGIAQTGRAYRNEISPRDFLFRTREFEQMELEYFFDPQSAFTLFTDKHRQTTCVVLTAQDQEKNVAPRQWTFGHLVESGKLSEIHAYWLVESLWWFESIGISKENLRLREHTAKELSHYSSATFDLEYDFPGMGFKELFGCADRGNYDLSQHEKHSKHSMQLHDDRTNRKVVPSVIEPSFGLGRTFLAVLCDAYEENKQREQTILHLKSRIAPVQIGVFPLVKKLSAEAEQIMDVLEETYACFYDESGSIGRRYARQDEIGTPYCITVDFDSLDDKAVTLRDRDSTQQKRIAIEKLPEAMRLLMNGKTAFAELS